MRFTINTQDFIEALRIGGSMSGKSKILPFTRYAKVEVYKDGRMQISSCDGDVGIVRKGAVLSSENDCSFCVQPKELVDILSTIKDNTIDYTLTDGWIELHHSKGNVTVPVIKTDDFVMPSEEEYGISLTMPANELYGCLKNARVFCGTDEIRPTLTGVLLKIDGQKVTIAASDAHKLYIDGFNIREEGTSNLEAIIPNKAVRPIIDALYTTDTANVSIGDSSIRISTPDTIITSKLIVGKYPNVLRLVADNYNLEVVVNKNELLESLSRTLLSSDSTSRLVKIGVSEGSPMTLVAEDVGFSKKSEDSIDVESNPVNMPLGWDFKIGVKGSLLLDCLSSISSEEVVFRFIDNKKAIQILDRERTKKIVILMPVMITS